MTTLSINVDDRTLRRLARRSEAAGKTPAELLEEYARRLSAVEEISDFAEANTEALKKRGITSEEEFERLVQEGIQESRAARRSGKR